RRRTGDSRGPGRDPVRRALGGLAGDRPGPARPRPESAPGDKGPSAGLRSEQVVPVHVEEQMFDDYYNGCCNATFWPLFHSMPDRAVFQVDKWEWLSVQRKIERPKSFGGRSPALRVPPRLLPTSSSSPPHLLLVSSQSPPRLLLVSSSSLTGRGGFPIRHHSLWELEFERLQWTYTVQTANASVLVRQAYSTVNAMFADQAVESLKMLKAKEKEGEERIPLVWIHDYHLMLAANNIRQRFEDMANAAPRALQSSQQIILGVDRLDYTKGLVNRIRSFERLLEKHPEHLEKGALMQVAVPSLSDVMEYQQLKEQIDLEVGRINGRFSTANWSPIQYIYGCIPQDELATFYRDSSVALVTPLRDGMNLVAKEYVTCQVDKPGVLILSPFAGAGETMHEALLVNPYELDGVADTLHRALTMPDDEREMRMNHLKKREKTMNLDFWLSSFLKAMGSLDFGEGQNEPMTTETLGPMTMEDFDEFLSKYIGDTAKIALLLDYDGTLAPITSKPDMAFMPAEMKNVLVRLSNSSDVAIAIVSGRSLEDVRKMVGIDGITYAGNHGLEILHPDGSKFIHPIPEEYQEKMRNMCRELQDACCREGAWVENKGDILTYHLRAVPIPRRVALKQKATAIIIKNGFKAYSAHCAIEARPPVQWDKVRLFAVLD
ncbi:unnamed protein product, partial [Darwinula stevensoni]